MDCVEYIEVTVGANMTNAQADAANFGTLLGAVRREQVASEAPG